MIEPKASFVFPKKTNSKSQEVCKVQKVQPICSKVLEFDIDWPLCIFYDFLSKIVPLEGRIVLSFKIISFFVQFSLLFKEAFFDR